MSVEHANGGRGLGVYPAHWGRPEGSTTSDERLCWVQRNVAEDTELRRRGLDPAEARSGRRKTLTGEAALARVERLKRAN